MPNVLFMTVAKDDQPAPLAFGLYDNMAKAVYGLNCVGIHPGFCAEHPLFNPDGTKAGVIMAGDGISATLTVMPLETAMALARRDTKLWDVPDYCEEV